MTREDELRAAGRLAGEALAGLVEILSEMHQAVSHRVTALLPPGARAIGDLQATMARTVYAGVAAGQRLAAAGCAEALAQRGGLAPAPSQTPLGRFVLPAVSGIFGDTVAQRHPALAIPTAVRLDGADVPLDAAGVAAAFPHPTSRVIVFVHGLAENEGFWWGLPGMAQRRSYGDQLREEGMTPVYLRYNSGRRISDNGQEVADLMQRLLALWPVPVTDISFVGHSMGGLVARSACRHAEIDGADWVRAVRAVVTLGTPHLGAPLEQAVHVADWMLSHVPETAPLARLLRSRSAGVRDLRFGAVVAADWEGHDPDAFLRDTCTDVPFLADVTYYFVAASLTRDVRHPVGHLLGDGLVRYPSAAGSHRTKRFPFDLDSRHLGGLHHFSLLNHPDVYEVLRGWVT